MKPGLRGDRISQLRKARGLTQYDLADELGIAQNLVSRYERGGVHPTFDTLSQIADLLDTTADYLMGRSNIPHPGAEPDANPDLTPDEIELLNAYRNRSEDDRKLLLGIAKMLTDIRGDG